MNEQSDELFKSCSFCVIEKRKKDLYKCSNCGQTYCSLRCYRSKRHSKCSEKFYEEQCRDAAGEKVEASSSKKDEVERPKVTFEEYMDSKEREQRDLTEETINPQIPVGKDEEILFDSDDEPDYLKNVVDSTLKQFDEADAFDIDKQLLAAGLPLDLDKNSGEIAQEQLESLYQKLNDEEKQSFTRLADDMFSEQMGFNMSCFKKK